MTDVNFNPPAKLQRTNPELYQYLRDLTRTLIDTNPDYGGFEAVYQYSTEPIYSLGTKAAFNFPLVGEVSCVYVQMNLYQNTNISGFVELDSTAIWNVKQGLTGTRAFGYSILPSIASYHTNLKQIYFWAIVGGPNPVEINCINGGEIKTGDVLIADNNGVRIANLQSDLGFFAAGEILAGNYTLAPNTNFPIGAFRLTLENNIAAISDPTDFAGQLATLNEKVLELDTLNNRIQELEKEVLDTKIQNDDLFALITKLQSISENGNSIKLLEQINLRDQAQNDILNFRLQEIQNDTNQQFNSFQTRLQAAFTPVDTFNTLRSYVDSQIKIIQTNAFATASKTDFLFSSVVDSDAKVAATATAFNELKTLVNASDNSALATSILRLQASVSNLQFPFEPGLVDPNGTLYTHQHSYVATEYEPTDTYWDELQTFQSSSIFNPTNKILIERISDPLTSAAGFKLRSTSNFRIIVATRRVYKLTPDVVYTLRIRVKRYSAGSIAYPLWVRLDGFDSNLAVNDTEVIGSYNNTVDDSNIVEFVRKFMLPRNFTIPNLGGAAVINISSLTGVTFFRPVIFIDPSDSELDFFGMDMETYYLDGSTNALITQEQIARASGDSAITSSVTSLTTTVNGNTASISNLFSTVDGIRAEATLNLDVNGNIVGYKFLNTGATSSFKMRADQFILYGPNGTGGKQVFSVDTVSGEVQISGRLLIDTGTHVLAQGSGFGTANQFVLWFGPKTALNAMSEATALFYLTKNGYGYFRGGLDNGTLRYAVNTSNVPTNSPYLVLGPFGSNGLPKKVQATVSISAGGQLLGAGSVTGSYTINAVVEKSKDGSTWTNVATMTSLTTTYEFIEPYLAQGEPGSFQSDAVGSTLYTDTDTSVTNYWYRFRVISINYRVYSGSNNIRYTLNFQLTSIE